MQKLLVLMVALGLVFSLNSWVHADSAVIENPANGHKYQRIDSARTWHAAKSYCENQGKYLVTVTSSAENDFVFYSLLYDTVPTDENVYGWLGATDEAVEGEWEWVTGETWSYAKWIGIEPNNYGPGEHYLVYWRESGGWADYGPPLRPTVTLPFVCEWEEGFVLENTGTGDVYVNDVPVPQGSNVPLEESAEISLDEKSEITIDHKCFHSLVFLLTAKYWEKCIKETTDDEDIITRAVCKDYALRNGVTMSVLWLNEDPSLCRQENSKPNAVGSSHISLELQSGAGRFNSVLDNFSLDIETDTAKVSSLTQNDFAVGHSPDTHLTVAACYKGSVTVDPTNPALSSVTLSSGQKVNIWSDRIGPITNIGQVNTAPFLLLLDDGAK